MPNGSTEFSQRRVFAAGETIFRQGDEARAAFVVQDGEIEVSRDVGGQRKVLYKVGRNGIVGQMALVDGRPMMADATARTMTVCMMISREQFERKLHGADPFIKKLVQIIVGNVRTTLDHNVLPELGQS